MRTKHIYLLIDNRLKCDVARRLNYTVQLNIIDSSRFLIGLIYEFASILDYNCNC